MAVPWTVAFAPILLVALFRGQQIEGSESNENTCTLYIAESSVEGVNGVGIFTAKSFARGSIVSIPDSPSIPVCDPWPDSGLVNHYWWGEGKGTSDEMSFECIDYTVDYFGAYMNERRLLIVIPRCHSHLAQFLSVLFPTIIHI